MVLLALTLAAAVNWADRPAIPGGCTEPVGLNAGKPGCWVSATFELEPGAREVWWHIYEFPTAEAAARAKAPLKWSATAASHGRAWLFVVGARDLVVTEGVRRAVIGPLELPQGRRMTARFLESTFTPGMHTIVHSHPGPEAFYVVEGEQCMERPGDRAKLHAGETYVVPPGPHLQAAAKGRKNLVLLLYPSGGPAGAPADGWTPSQFCAE